MKKTLVIYKSKYGYTKKYAQAIAKALSCEAIEIDAISTEKLNNYDVIIFGGGLYVGTVAGSKIIASNWDKISMKKIIVFAVGAHSEDKSNEVQPITIQASTSEMLKKIKTFYLRGGLDYSRLTFIHKMGMGMMKKMINKKIKDGTATLADKEILSSFDATDISTITPIVEYTKG